MLIKRDITGEASPVIRKSVNQNDVSHRGAFACGDVVTFTVETPRKLGATAVVMRLYPDGEDCRDLPLSFTGTGAGVDTYRLSLDTALLCGEAGSGLFYYEFLFLRGLDTLFTDTQNGLDFTLASGSAGRFLLLMYKKDFRTPGWFRGGIMYHVFVDRFFRGEGEVEMREDACIDEDWENGIPQYPENRGGKLSNNVFFGGNLWGVSQKLEYLKSLGVSILYLSPIFRAYSNHKYDTGDYLEIDGMFGGEPAFRELLEHAGKLGIRVILDGVFNHTGDDSRYFDRYGTYGGTGAYTNPDSPYRDWYCFTHYPDRYKTWWGIEILPKLNPESDSCREFLVGQGGVVEKYLRMGTSGWRLDVADELTDRWLDELRSTAKSATDGEAVIIGEVWENAAEKVAYGKRRRYLRGDQLDSVMNYPFRSGVLDFLLNEDAERLADTLKEIYVTYPKCVCDCLMNLLGTHDTERILTVLGGGLEFAEEANPFLANRLLTNEDRRLGLARLKLGALLQYTVYGVPSVFYGDEVGVEGYHDPFCRRPFPWGHEDRELLAFYRKLGRIRGAEPVFADGDFCIIRAHDGVIGYIRSGEYSLTVLVNAKKEPVPVAVPGQTTDLLTGHRYGGMLPPLSGVILKETR